jgi:cell division protein FtsI (penicillin-binding protein 3)
VVLGGTAKTAEIALGEMAGKTGTAQMMVDGAYSDGHHTATFAGMFPAAAPQFVIVVRLTDPEASYGGAAAAPVTASVLRAAAVTQHSILDRKTLMRGNALASLDSAQSVLSRASDEDDAAGEDDAVPGARPRMVTLDLSLQHDVIRQSGDARPVPHVAGLRLREAVFLLHRAGFKVRLSGASGAETVRAAATSPSAGSIRKAGDLITLVAGT